MRHPHKGVGAFFMSIIRQHPKKHKRQSRPPWGKVAGVSLTEGGNSLSNQDCPPTSPPSPTHHANKTAPNAQGHTPPQASSPPPSPNGPTSHPKGEAKLLTAKQEPEMSRPPWGKVAGVSLTEGGNSLSILDCPQPRHPTQRTYPSDCKAGARDEPSPLGEGGPRQRWKGGTR